MVESEIERVKTEELKLNPKGSNELIGLKRKQFRPFRIIE